MIKFKSKETKAELKFVDLMNEQLIVSTKSLSEYEKLSDEQKSAMQRLQDIYGYCFERLWDNGTLDAILQNPTQALEGKDLRLLLVKNEHLSCKNQGYYVNKGADYILAAKVLYDIAKSAIDNQYRTKSITFQASIPLKKWEGGIQAEPLIAKSQELQIELTREYFMKELLKQNDSAAKCRQLVEALEGLILPITLTQIEEVEDNK